MKLFVRAIFGEGAPLNTTKIQKLRENDKRGIIAPKIETDRAFYLLLEALPSSRVG